LFLLPFFFSIHPVPFLVKIQGNPSPNPLPLFFVRFGRMFVRRDGIDATYRAKVNIHLPSQHNTSHDNVGEDRMQDEGGSIANINTDGTFTHIVVDEDDEEDEE